MFNLSYLQQMTMIESVSLARNNRCSVPTLRVLRDRESNFYSTQIGLILAIHRTHWPQGLTFPLLSLRS
jgi:hypothetical protein